MPARVADVDGVIEEIAEEEGISPREVRRVVASQFRLIRDVAESDTFEEVRLYKFGRFYVPDGRLDYLEKYGGEVRRNNGSNGRERGS